MMQLIEDTDSSGRREVDGARCPVTADVLYFVSSSYLAKATCHLPFSASVTTFPLEHGMRRKPVVLQATVSIHLMRPVCVFLCVCICV